MENISKHIEELEQSVSEILDRLNTISNGNIENFDTVRKEDSKSKDNIFDNRNGLIETFEATLTNTDDVAIKRQAIEELFEMITAESEVK